MVIGPRTPCQRPSVTASPSPGGRPREPPLQGVLGMRGSTGMWLPRPSPGGRPREPPLQGVDGDVVAAAPAPAGGHESRPYRVSGGGVAITGMWLPRPQPRRAATRAAPTGCPGDAWFNGDVVAAAPAPAGGHESRPYRVSGGMWLPRSRPGGRPREPPLQGVDGDVVAAAQPRRAATRAAPTGCRGGCGCRGPAPAGGHESRPYRVSTGMWLPRPSPGGRPREPPLRGIGGK